MPDKPFRIFIGWDQREPEAYEVARFPDSWLAEPARVEAAAA